ncbi:rho GTPase-activating protein 11B-like [Lingula anatina]|uniref:Rho GTPase-activating protein 11B-like n=1 Tax=Lingula anatina TaxID=7574 RepID=A0A1S3JJ57_LINAN|nr:rho GTPase-activating protein 11B-like [Lingula anatina]|eukprot:XP_013409939.2 rho GTPase-activating protein 11B-like [Lingula anatina]
MAVQDLKEKGVKVPKLRKRRCPSSQSGHTQDKGDRYVFGNNLFSMPGVFIEDCGFVPKFLVDAFTVVKNHIDTVGIFRKTGSVARQKELKHNLDNGGDLEVESSNVFDVTSLIKQFFRELPDSLLTTRLHDVFIKCHQLQESDSRLKHIQLMCLLLPLENLSTLKFTMQCCAEIASHSENNKMNMSNLAVVLTPNLIHTNSKSEKMTQVEGQLLAAQTSIIELLIEHSADIGMVDESLQERSHMMSTCFASEDELDRSCDESEEPKSKKKKRRSGSLQGIVSGISNTISKWSKRGGIKGASSNQSLVSSSSADMEDSSVAVDVGDAAGISIGIMDATPIVVRKRKASDEGVPFSATKR